MTMFFLADLVDLLHFCLIVFVMWGWYLDPGEYPFWRKVHYHLLIFFFLDSLLNSPLAGFSNMLRGSNPFSFHLLPQFPLNQLSPIGIFMIIIIIVAVGWEGFQRDRLRRKMAKSQETTDAAA